jgi:uncharacterized protein YggE
MTNPLICIVFVAAALGSASDAVAEPGRIVAPGIAVADVAPDSLTVDFELETASETLEQGAARARAVAADLQSIAPPLEGVKLSVERDLTFMQQKKWTIATKQQFKFRLQADRVPEGQAETCMVALVQSALAKVPALTVTGFEARLSELRTKQLHAVLLKQAIADAREFAAIAAAEAHLDVRSVRSLRVGRPGSESRPYELDETVTVSAEPYGYRRRGFSVSDELASTIRVSVRVVVEYECEPR